MAAYSPNANFNKFVNAVLPLRPFPMKNIKERNLFPGVRVDANIFKT